MKKLLAIFLGTAIIFSNMQYSNVNAATSDTATSDTATSDTAASDTAASDTAASVVLDTDSFSPTGRCHFTDKTYTHNKAIYSGKNIYQGIDVSKYQGTIDWNKVKNDGVQFAIIRLGNRLSSSGKIVLDPYYEKNMNGAIAAGIPVGVYFYTEAITTAEAREEAKYCLEKVKGYKLSLPIAFDFEYTNKYGRLVKAKLSKSASTKQCEAFCDTIKAAKYTPMVYTSTSTFENNLDGAALSKKYEIWDAQYNKECKLFKTAHTDCTYSMWQYSSSGKISGISGRNDCNFWYTTKSLKEIIGLETKITKASFSYNKTRTYSGKALKPSVKVTYKGATLKKNVDYTVSYSKNTKVGTAYIYIRGKGNYGGQKSLSFKIVPKTVKNIKKKAGYKSIKLSWSKNSHATGYKIYRKSTYNGKTYKAVKCISKNYIKNYTDYKLKNDKEYFYAIRAYTKVNSKRYYSDYTYLNGATHPSGKNVVAKNSRALYKKPDLSGTKLITIPKKATVKYIGRTYTKGSAYVIHVKYTVKKKTYSGYVKNTFKF